MKIIDLYDADGNKSLEFKFQNPEFKYNEQMNWTTIHATGRSFYVKNIPFIAYDEEIRQNGILPEFGDLTHSQINEAYTGTGKLIIIFTTANVPFRMFYGEAISFVGENHFKIDDKDLWVFGLNYLILSKDK